ncbi:MAG: pyridoxal phosphate-dependent aminotransferase [Candidatus Hodarchaeales archaeon]|jgi:aspartate/methionine/tyrosine aminotransferase
MLDLSPRASRLKPSATLAMHELVHERQAKGDVIFHMGTGESPFPVHPHVKKALCENADKKSYLPVQGIPALREQISAFYQRMFNLNYSAEQIIVGPGSKILLFAALVALEGSLFLPAPSWVSYQHQAHLMGKSVCYVKTSSDNSYRLTPASLEETITKHEPTLTKQKILLLNYPCNPTGASYSAAQLKEIASVARDHNVVVLSDEIYGLISFQGQEHHSIAEFYPEGTIVTGGISKDRSLGGFRVGTMLLPEEAEPLKKTLLSIGSETWSCVAAPIQHAALAAYRTDEPTIIDHIRDCTAIHRIITQYVHRRLEQAEVSCPPPQGAFYLFPDWNKYREVLEKEGIRTATELSERLLGVWNIATLPGIEFGMDPSNLCIRIATVDYDGEAALKRFQEDRNRGKSYAEEFVNSVAPRVVQTCDQFERFMENLSGKG